MTRATFHRPFAAIRGAMVAGARPVNLMARGACAAIGLKQSVAAA